MGSLWRAWDPAPDIVIPLVLVSLAYLAGAARRSEAKDRIARFLSGVAAIFLALCSPVDALAERLFCMHQVQHLLLMMVAPALLMGSAPEAALLVGLPPGVRHGVLAPIVRNRGVRALFSLLTHPVAATLLCGATLYAWMIPADFGAALRSEGLHYCMHMTMLAAGLLFWWRVLDARRPPAGAHDLARVGMLTANLMMVSFLGAYLIAKTEVLYAGTRPWGLLQITSLADERLGGAVLWLGGGSVLVAALARTLRRWVLAEIGKESTAR